MSSVQTSALLAFLALTCWSGAAHAHGIADIEGTLTVSPVDAREGTPITLEVTIEELSPGVMADAQVHARLGTGSDAERIDLARVDALRFRGTSTLPEGHTSVRILVERDGLRDFAVSGLSATPRLQPLSGVDAELWFVPAGRVDSLPWLDGAAGLVVLLLGVFALAWRLRHPTSKTGATTAAPARERALAVAAVGALLTPFGAFWDVAYHAASGRDSLFSAPHGLIYGGILCILAAAVLMLRARPEGQRRAEFLRENRAVAAAILGVLLVVASAPLDELWHTLFGLDVSIWSPPHSVLIAGAYVAMVGFGSVRGTACSSFGTLPRVVLLAASLLVVEFYVVEALLPFPSWHVSQQRPTATYPLFLAVGGSLSLLSARFIPLRRAPLIVAFLFLALRLCIYPFLAAMEMDVVPAFSIWLVLPVLIALAVVWSRPLSTEGVRRRVPPWPAVLLVALLPHGAAAQNVHVVPASADDEWVSGSVPVAAPRARLWERLTAVQQWDRIFSDITRVQVISSSAGSLVAKMESRGFGHMSRWRLRFLSPGRIAASTEAHGVRVEMSLSLLDKGRAGTLVRMRIRADTVGLGGWFVPESSIRRKELRLLRSYLHDLSRAAH